MDLDELKRELAVTQEDYDNLHLSEEELNRKNTLITFMSNYAFNCQCCEKVAPWLNPYRIIKGALTTFEFALAGLARGTRQENVKSLEGVFHLSSLEEKPEYESTLNWVKDFGNVCDHCYDTVFKNN